MTTISVIIICKNEEQKIAECIQSVEKVADQIIVYDNGSKDHTKEIARKYGATVFEDTQWAGYGLQRQKAQKYATCDFCLWLDADERLTDETVEEIKSFVATAKENMMLCIPRKNWAFGTQIKHSGWKPNRIIRLHNNKYTTYNESLVHESIKVKPDSIILTGKNPIIHYPCDNYYSFMQKQLNYADLWARQHYENNCRCTSIFRQIISSVWSFFVKYIVRKGFLDGRAGFCISSIVALYTFHKYMELYILTMIGEHKATPESEI